MFHGQLFTLKEIAERERMRGENNICGLEYFVAVDRHLADFSISYFKASHSGHRLRRNGKLLDERAYQVLQTRLGVQALRVRKKCGEFAHRLKARFTKTRKGAPFALVEKLWIVINSFETERNG